MKDTYLHLGKLKITNRKVRAWFTFASLHKGETRKRVFIDANPMNVDR